MDEAGAKGPAVSSRIPEDFLGALRVSGFTWCEALSPGVPKPSAQLRDNLWSEVSFLHRFRLACENGETFRDNLWWPISSKPEKDYSSIPASAATAPTRDQVTQRRLHDSPRAESCAQASGTALGTNWRLEGCFSAFWLHMVRSTLPRSPEAVGAASRLLMV